MHKVSFAAYFAAAVLFQANAAVAADTTCPNYVPAKCATIETVVQLEGSSDSDPQPWVLTSGYGTQGDGGGGVLYAPLAPLVTCTPNGGSCVTDSNGHYYRAQTFPTNVLQWGADPAGISSSSTMVQNELDAQAIPGTPGAVVYFPPGTYLLSGITLPTSIPPPANLAGVHVYCAGEDVTTLMLPTGANTWMFATWNYVNNKTNAEPPAEINGCTINLNNANQTSFQGGGIVIDGTDRSRIHDNEIDNGYGPAVLFTTMGSGTSPNCAGGATGDEQIFHNVFAGSYGAAISDVSGVCPGISDRVIADNVFATNGKGISGANLDYQVDIAAAAGWGYRGNKSFGGTCGELLMNQVGSGVITNNRFDIGSNAASSFCPAGGTSGSAIESIVLSIGSNKGFTFSGNSMDNHTVLSLTGTTWDALEVTNNGGGCGGGFTVGDNVFSNIQSATFSLNAINYNGSCTATVQLPALGNFYSPQVTLPSNPEIITGTEQYFSMTATGTQTAGTAYFPVSGYTGSVSLSQLNAQQSWGQTGFFTANTTGNCGKLTHEPGGTATYTFQLMVNSTVPTGGVTCTFSGSSKSGVGTGSPVSISNGQTVEWQAMQSPGSVAANPSLNLSFARQ